MSTPDNIREVYKPRWYQNPYFYPLILTLTCVIIFAGGTILYTTWAIGQSQLKWCTVIELLNSAPAPKASPGNPSRIYDAKLAADFRALQRELGC